MDATALAFDTGFDAVPGRYGVDVTAVNPWFHPTPEAYRARLERAASR